jgi:hypothetical protein
VSPESVTVEHPVADTLAPSNHLRRPLEEERFAVGRTDASQEQEEHYDEQARVTDSHKRLSDEPAPIQI